MVHRRREQARAPISKINATGRREAVAPPGNHSKPRPQNRLRQIVWHIPWYGFRTQARLAQDSGVSPSAISRIMRGKAQPTLPVAQRLTDALSRRLNLLIDLRDVFSPDGTYPTPSVCHLTRCPSCLPPTAYDETDNLRPEFQSSRAGQWGVSPGAQTPTGTGKGGE